MSDTTTTDSIHDRYLEADAARTEASRRLHALQAQGAALSLDERLEKLGLADQLSDLERVLPGLQRAVLLEETRLDIAAVVAQWRGLVDAKRDAYAALFGAVSHLHETYEALLMAHRAQVQAVGRLPAGVRERLAFPDEGAFRHNLLTRSTWDLDHMLPPTQGDAAAIQDVDPGVKAINPRLIARLLKETAQWNERY